MDSGYITHEKNGDVTHLPGRDVIWLQKPETTGGKYTSVCTCIYEPGGRAYPGHSHPNGEETVYVISGTGRVRIGDVYYDIEPGSLFLFPQGVPHMVWNNGSVPLHIVCVYAPTPEAAAFQYYEDFDHPEFQKAQISDRSENV